jgi:hypothetical protein
MDEDQQMLCLTDGVDDVASNARLRSGKRDWSQSQEPSGLRRGSVASRLLGFQIRTPPGAWMSVSCECCVCCYVVVSATSRSLVQRIPTDCGVPE